MRRAQHIFRQELPGLADSSVRLAETAVRIITLHHLIETLKLDALIIPPGDPEYLPFWQTAFSLDRIICNPESIPHSHRQAGISMPTQLDRQFGEAAWTVFERVMWESGFFQSKGLSITPPLIFPAGHRTRGLMVYPSDVIGPDREEEERWLSTICITFLRLGFHLNLFGSANCHAFTQLAPTIRFEQVFDPSVNGLRQCVAASCLAIGGQAGASWALMLSDIPQIVRESKLGMPAYWDFDRCQTVLTKPLKILPTLESLLF